MFSQFISPTKRVNPKPKPAVPQEEEEKYILSLAPFTNLPKICFDNVLLGTTCVKTLIVRNPTPNDIRLIVTRIPQKECHIELSWYEEIIQCNEDVFLKMQWTPVAEGNWRDVITFEDGRRLKKDAVINFKCVRLKKTKPKAKPKPAVVSTKLKSPLRRKFSPTKKMSPTKPYRRPLPDITNHPTIVITSTEEISHSTVENKHLSISYVKKDKEDKENIFSKNNTNFVNVTFGLSESKLRSPNKDLSCDYFEDSLESPKKINLHVSETLEDKINRLALSPDLNLPKGSFREEINTRETFTKTDSGGNTYTKLNISSSTQISDTTMDLLLPKTSICNLSPIRKADDIVETSGAKNGLESIVEETSSECAMTNNKILNSKPREIKVKFKSPKSKFTKTTPLNLKAFIEKNNTRTEELGETKEESIKLHDAEKIIYRVQDPFVLTATSDIDPFISSSIYYNLQWVDKQEISFKKWLNALLTPPTELNSDENIQVDVGKLWADCKKREINKAPTREVISNKYHIKSWLDSLRKSAFEFLTSPKISKVLSTVSSIVENNKLQIREDRDVHLNLSLQSEIMTLFVSYNPLWLRIGLETLYGHTIPLKSNSDIMGLLMFISENYFKDPYLLKKYKSVHSQKYTCDIKKLILKKFLTLVYFLDQAKLSQLIPHKPCLFSKQSQYKESREILLKFSRDLLYAVGDVTKYLRHFGYVLSHKQTYIHEFDYAVSDLGIDLRDGVRLTRAVEIILLKDNLVDNLRVPAISRLQKVHNVKVVFDALTEANFTILHDIQPKDIVDGHKEKTLSFLWQIIYKFEASKLKKATITIQKWWRSLCIVLKRSAMRRYRQKQIDSAIKIQRWYKRMLLSKLYKNLIPIVKELMAKRQMENAVTKLQMFFKMIIIRKNYLKIRATMISLQAHSRRWLISRKIKKKLAAIIKIQSTYRMSQKRKYYLKLKRSVFTVEQYYLAKKLMLNTRNNYLLLKNTVLFIEEKYCATKEMRIHRENYLKLKQTTLIIQQRYRATKLMLGVRNEFLELKNSVVNIQSRYRANKMMEKTRNRYLQLRSAAILTQRKFRANQLMKKQKREYNNLKHSSIVIQRWFRSIISMRVERENYRNILKAVKFIQSKYRAKIAMRTQLKEYKLLRKYTIAIQAKYRGKKQLKIYLEMKEKTTMIQQWYRSTLKMRKDKNNYLKLRDAAVYIQGKVRANQQMKKQKMYYEDLKQKTIIIQRWFRSIIVMKKERYNYKNILKAVVFIQTKYRATISMRKQQNEYILLKKYSTMIQAKYRGKKQLIAYLETKEKIVKIQRWYRSLLKMQEGRDDYLKLRDATIYIQRKFRANRQMRKERMLYENLKLNSIVIQRWFRASILMKKERNNYKNILKAVVLMQIKFRAKMSMMKQVKEYNLLKKYTIMIQAKYRGKKQLTTYLETKEQTIKIQRWYRSVVKMQDAKKNYLKLRHTTIYIQRKFRANQEMKKQRITYKNLKQSSIFIQRWFRSTSLMKKERDNYKNILRAVVFIQTKYRAKISMRKQQKEYLLLKKYSMLIQAKYRGKKQLIAYLETKQKIIKIQRWYRSLLKMREARDNYLNLRHATIYVQRKFRANRQMRKEKMLYENLKRNSIVIQRWFRATILMKKERNNYKSILKAVVLIQTKFRAKMLMMRQIKEYNLLKKYTTMIQAKYRGKKQLAIYLETKEQTIKIQRWYRSLVKMQVDRNNYLKIRNATVYIQQKIRANRQMKQQKRNYDDMKKKAVVLQRWCRSLLQMKKDRNHYLKFCHAVIYIQRKFRAKMEIKAQKKLIHLEQKAIVIQRWYKSLLKMREDRSYYLKLKKSVVLVQNRYRAKLLMRKERQCLEEQAIKVQRRYRALKQMKVERRAYLKLKQAVKRIQEWYRNTKKEREVRNLFIKRLQARLRGFLIRNKYKEELSPEKVAERARKRLLNKAARKIQAVWRGHHTRSRQENRVTVIREKLKIANHKFVKQDTLEARMKEAVSVILCASFTSTYMLNKMLKKLDFQSRVSKEMCIELSTKIPEFLYNTMNFTTRSQPESETLTLCTSILINFWKIPEARENSWYPKYIDIVVTKMTCWCDKDNSLFVYLCTLLWLFAHDKKCKRIIKGIPQYQQRFSKIKSLCERKQKMSKNTVSVISYFGVYKGLQLPSLKPDWGIDYKERPRIFTNSMQAIEALINILESP